MLPIGTVGFVVARRVPGNPIGSILLVLALLEMFTSDVGFYAVRAFRLHDTALPLARLAVFLGSGWVWIVVLLPLPIALFPDGKWLRGRWRATLPLYIASSALLVVAVAWEYVHGSSARQVRLDSGGNLVGGASGAAAVSVTHVTLVVCVGIGFGWVVRQVSGWRGSRRRAAAARSSG